MKINEIRTGSVFYYEDHLAHNGTVHRHKCRVLFVGSENIFYDAWWEGISKWTYVPVSKRVVYYRFPISHMHRLTFDGFAPIDEKSQAQLFIKSPEVLLSFSKEEIEQGKIEPTPIEAFSEKIAFIPSGPKGGWLKPVIINAENMTADGLANSICQHQNLDYIAREDIIVDRAGLVSGIPSYSIKNY